MKYVGRIFVRGLLTVLPVVVTAWVLWWLGSMAERSLGGALRLVLPDEYYLPGLGLLVGAVLVFLIGLFVQAWLVRTAWSFMERQLQRVPLVKTVYGSVRDFVGLFREGGEDRLGRPVLLELGGANLVGFVTNDDASQLGLGEDHVVVYLPMGYQIGGYTVAVAKDAMRPVESLNTQQAMRYVLTAGITGEADGGRADDERPGEEAVSEAS